MMKDPVPSLKLVFKILSCFLLLSRYVVDAEQFIVHNDEIYLESHVPSVIDRSTPPTSTVLVKSSREIFYDIFSKFETYKKDDAIWTYNAQNGRRTLTNLKYTICPIWLKGETNGPANVTRMNTVMQANQEYYKRMSWNQHVVTWDFLSDLRVNYSESDNPTRGQVADYCLAHMDTIDKRYPQAQTGLIVAHNPTNTGQLNYRGGWGVINYNISWMSLEFGFQVTRHELGHNYGHPHHYAYSYTPGTFDGYDMMSNGNSGIEAHFSAAAKYFFNWIPTDAVIMMQPEGPTAACPTCKQSISKVVLRPFDNVAIVPSKSNLMAVHIPVLGLGDSNVYSYWLSYRSNYTDSRNGLSMHIVNFNLGGMFGATYESLNFDANGDTSTTADSFVVNGTCYVMQRLSYLMDVDRSAVEQIQPVVCVDDIDKGNSITISVSFLNQDAPTIAFQKQNPLQCNTAARDFGKKSLDMVSNKVHLLEYNGTGQDGNVTFSACLASGSASVKAYFYDSYPYAYLSYKAPPSYGAFLSVPASALCSNAPSTTYVSRNGQTFVLVIADGPVTSGTTVQYSSSCRVNTCHAGQYMEQGVCMNCPPGHVSVPGSVSLDNCLSCIADGLEPVGALAKDCRISLRANPALNTGRSWRIMFPAVQANNGWAADVDELEFYDSDDCRASSKISTAGGTAFSSGYYDEKWRPELAFGGEWWRWGGRPDDRGLFFLGLTFNRTVTVRCIKYIQPDLMVKELRIQAKPENEKNWNNVLIVRSLPNLTNVIPIVVVPTSAPTLAPQVPTVPVASMPSLPTVPTTTGETTTCNSPENTCRAGFFRFLSASGQTMHRTTLLGRCVERCSALTAFQGFMGIFGWKCGSC